ncbi:uncharacterized protein [Henckelia pumila]|uniref:uncharacterized protein n=1 Tax=Henckelia pumila TaxID=405737 RepID=UPI003C6E1F98
MDFGSDRLRFLCFFLLLIFSPIRCQAQIPAEHDGFWYGKRPDRAESVVVEAFFDPVCPDSRDSWPPLKKVVQYYGSRVTLVAHTFPLPYHDNSFVSSRALHIVNKLNTTATYSLLEAFFDHQEQFYGSSTLNLSRASVVDKIVKFVIKELGPSFLSAIKSGFTDSKTDQVTRVAFKYGCIRGVYGTPSFFVNGFPVPDAGSPLDYEKWREIIDPLVTKILGLE